MTEVPAMVERLPTYSDEKLMILFQNCGKEVAKNGKRSREAEQIMDAVGEEWGRRMAAALHGTYAGARPSVGMLATLGYHVGQAGTPKAERRAILDYVMEGRLPLVHSLAYVLEWGPSNSTARFSKLRRTIEGLISNKANAPNSEKAIIEWLEDLDYIDAKWGSA